MMLGCYSKATLSVDETAEVLEAQSLALESIKASNLIILL